jgi:hypothetical protein
MDEKAKTFHNSGFVSTAIREIQRLLSDDESVIIWRDEWQFNKDGNMPTNYVNDDTDAITALRRLVNGIPEEYDDKHTKGLLEVAQSAITANLNKRRTLREGLYLSPRECEHLEDALQEWDDTVSPKELEDNEVGLNGDRYSDLMDKLRKCINAHTE